MAADAAARAPDVASAQGEWEEEPREEGGATEKKEAALRPPDSSPLCFCKRFLLFFIFGWDIGILPPSIVPCHSRIAPSICVSAFTFLHVAVPGAPSPALPPRLPLRDHPLPACACVHNIADVQHHSPEVGQAVVPTAAHLPPITLMVLTYLLFQLFLSPLCRLRAFLGRPLMTNLRNSTASLSNDRTNLTSDVARSFVSKPTTPIYQQLHPAPREDAHPHRPRARLSYTCHQLP